MRWSRALLSSFWIGSIMMAFALSVTYWVDKTALDAERHRVSQSFVSTMPILMNQGNLIQLYSVIHTQTVFPCIVLDNRGKVMVSTHPSYNSGDTGPDTLDGNSPVPLIYGSRPIGSIWIGSRNPLSMYPSKYIFIAISVSLLSMLSFSVHRRRQHLKGLDRLVAFVAQSGRKTPLEFNPNSPLFPLAEALWLSVDRERRLREQEVEAETVAARAALARQVAHDIRSPLSALNIAIQGLDEFSEERKRILKAATARIQAIAQDLLGQSEGKSARLDEFTSGEPFEFLPGVEELIREKKLLLHSRFELALRFVVDESAVGAKIDIPSNDLLRALSNIINNAAEAIGDRGEIELKVWISRRHAIFQVTDNGCGIPEAILAQIGRQGVSYNKPNGHGLGLSHARRTLDQWGGTFEIRSTVGAGTTVTLTIPLSREITNLREPKTTPHLPNLASP